MLRHSVQQKFNRIESCMGYLLSVRLHFKGRIELLETRLALSETVELLMYVTVDVVLNVHHHPNVVVNSFMTVPALQTKRRYQ